MRADFPGGRPMKFIARIGLALSIGAFAVSGAAAQAALKIFDAHLHYNQEPNPYYELDKVLEIFRRNNIAGILATSRPNKGTHQLVDAKAPGLWVVPFIRPYRQRSDIQTWFDDPSIWELIQSESSVSSISRSSAIYGCLRIATRKRCCSSSAITRRRGSSGRIPAFPPRPPA
jgi:hypothetical protein